MATKREEERNEKIIRGLMKLPPNRRCINCNSLGPQYVCTNFWTFVCMACSGIHREFTHRVKSVSMSKFSSQEVEALQNGGNQRARETYLTNWDYQRQRLPDSSNAERVREFIKNVYVQKKYAGGNPSDKPPRDSPTHRSSENVTRRSDSYHSYSQSPPYDYQYEERRYGKLPLGLTSKSASERGLYAKASSFAFSPGRYHDRIFEDQFANEGSAPRASDFSVSSGGDPFRSEIESPNSRKEVGFTSPGFQHSTVPSSENLHRTTNLFPDGKHQRTTSFGSVRSFDSNSMSVKSYNSSGLPDGVSENDQSTGSHQDKTSTPAPSSAHGALDLFGASVAPEAHSKTAPPIDLFQLPGAPAAQSVTTIQPSTVALSPPVDSYQPPHAYPSATPDLFAGIVDHQPTMKPPNSSVPKNEGWATFDSPISAAASSTEKITSSGFPQLDNYSVKLEENIQPSTSMQWPLCLSNPNQPALSIPSPWHDDLCGGQDNAVSAGNSPWNAFVEYVKDSPLDNANQVGEPADGASNSSSKVDQQHLDLQVVEDSSNDVTQAAKLHDDPSGFSFPGNMVSAPFYTPSMESVMEEPWPHVSDHKSTNPFDLPYDPEFEPNHTFLDMSSLQAALPDIQAPAVFHAGGVAQPWFAADFEASYLPPPAAAQGGSLAYMTGQASTSQIQTAPAQETVASIGGNPFA